MDSNRYEDLKDALLALGFKRLLVEFCIFYNDDCIIGIFVDDFLVLSSYDSVIDSLRDNLKKSFEIRDLGNVKHFLGMRINRGDDYIELDAHTFVKF